jgi:hypothetical protein
MLSCSWTPAGAPCEEPDEREKKKKGTPKKKISNWSGRSPANLLFLSLSLSLSQPTNWSFLDQSDLYCCALPWRGNTVSPSCQFSPLSAPSGATNQYFSPTFPVSLYHPTPQTEWARPQMRGRGPERTRRSRRSRSRSRRNAASRARRNAY